MAPRCLLRWPDSEMCVMPLCHLPLHWLCPSRGGLPTRVVSTFCLSHQSGCPGVTLPYQSELCALTVPFFTSMLYSLVPQGAPIGHCFGCSINSQCHCYMEGLHYIGGRCFLCCNVGAADSCATQPHPLMLSLSLKSSDAPLMVAPTMLVNTPSYPYHAGKQDGGRDKHRYR